MPPHNRGLPLRSRGLEARCAPLSRGQAGSALPIRARDEEAAIHGPGAVATSWDPPAGRDVRGLLPAERSRTQRRRWGHLDSRVRHLNLPTSRLRPIRAFGGSCCCSVVGLRGDVAGFGSSIAPARTPNSPRRRAKSIWHSSDGSSLSRRPLAPLSASASQGRPPSGRVRSGQRRSLPVDALSLVLLLPAPGLLRPLSLAAQAACGRTVCAALDGHVVERGWS
ncbi:hypothetical protein C8Q80DRAFT_345737 [Daedaleopsis nitida]|nr:hypothetical protein C8Q80DRAFT_345737 [Daedaleopsis nitida]